MDSEWKIKTLKSQLQIAMSNNNKRNRALDALGFLWCSGGCELGFQRYVKSRTFQDVKTMVEEINKNTVRVNAWFDKWCKKNGYTR